MQDGKARTPDTAPDGVAERARRDFLRRAGLLGLAITVPGLVAGCANEIAAPAGAALLNRETDGRATIRLDFSNELDVLNYAYALEQLEAAFYIKVIATPYAGINTQETRLLTDVRDHEIAHRDFFAAALGSAGIPALTPDFSSVNFSSRTSVLNTAKTFEDLGVAAYNGAARYLRNDRYLIVAGKIVSVEARHASAIRDLRVPRSGTFAPDAFDAPLSPTTVLRRADPFIVDTITAINT
ncbi:MAG: ferritin-like domain-containing protein [Gemmatimonadota bacterium]